MASIFTPTNWPALGPYRIDLTDCMGDSLQYINANTNYLASYTAAVSSAASTQIASANTRITALSTVPLARLQAGGQTGSAPLFGARAWVNFNGVGTNGANMVIRDSGNVSQVVKNSTGNYTITFSTSMPDTDYCTLVTGRRDSGGNIIGMIAQASPIYTTTEVKVKFTDTAGEPDNVDIGCVVIYR